MPTYEGLRLKIRKYWRCGLANYRKKKLKLDNFTIISNNCWGGMIYESYNLPKQTPTTGLFFMADDYLKFVANLKEYLHAELEFINPSASKWYAQNVNLEHYGEFPVGKLEIFTGGY